MVVPTDPKLRSTLANLAGVNINQREVEYRKALDDMIPGIFWGAKPSNIEAIRFLDPMIPRRSYKLTFDEPPKPGVPKQLFIDVKFGPSPLDAGVFVNATNPIGNMSTFDTGGRCQEIARTWLPDLVPRVIRVGIMGTDDGDIDYIVTEHIPNTVTLDKVWASLTPKTKGHIMDQLVTALKTLQKEHGFSEDDIEQALKAVELSGNIDYTATTILNLPKTLEPTPLAQRPAWPPQSTTLQRVRLLLQRYANEYRPAHHHCSATRFEEQEDGSVDVNFPGADTPMSPMILTCKLIHELSKVIVLCHMDLEPRNILAKLVEQPAGLNGKPEKELQLAGIISWHKATFAPFSMERGLKDALLGCQFNYDFSWYRLFADRTKHLMPDRFFAAHEFLVKAMVNMRFAARAMECTHSTTVHQQHFYAMEKIGSDPDYMNGWVRLPYAKDHESPSESEYREMGNGVIRQSLVKRFQEIPRHSWPTDLEFLFDHWCA